MMAKKEAKKYDPKGRMVHQVPDGCGPLFQEVYALLEDGQANEAVRNLLVDFTNALEFLESLPEKTKIGDLDLGQGVWPETMVADIEKATGRPVSKKPLNAPFIYVGTLPKAKGTKKTTKTAKKAT